MGHRSPNSGRKNASQKQAKNKQSLITSQQATKATAKKK